MNAETLGKVIANAKSEALRAALPAEPPEWWEEWWSMNMTGLHGPKDCWRALHSHLLGEDA